jgi:molybdate transport system ATP-binding protein
MHTSTATDSDSSALLCLEQASVRRQGRTVLDRISFTLHRDQNLLILGPNGAGKSTFLSLLRGDIWPLAHNGHPPRRFLVQGRWQVSPLGWKEATSLISPELELRFRQLHNLSCAQVISSGLDDSLRPLCFVGKEQTEKVQDQAAAFGLNHLLDRPFAALSSGEAQKALAARAMIRDPQLLFWDEMGTGLDPQARKQMSSVLSTLIHRGVQIVAATHWPDELAPLVPQVVVIRDKGLHGPLPAREALSREKGVPAASEGPAARPVSSAGTHRGVAHPPDAKTGAVRIRMEDVVLSIHGRRILGPLSWTLRFGENWLIHGPNGSGKSTLLQLLAGEIHQSAGTITRHPPLHSTSLQSLRRDVGLFTPGLLCAHQRSQTGLQTVLSGLRGQIGHRDRFTPEEEDQARSWLQALDCEHLAAQDITTLSSGQLRRVLLARSLVHNPCLLLLDEPCAGLDRKARQDLLVLLDRLAQDRVQMVMVSHRPQDTVSAINRSASLIDGMLPGLA